MINTFRRLLINIGKILPFVICFFVCINYTEIIISLLMDNVLEWNGYIIPNTSVSFYLGYLVEYNIQMLVLLTILSIAIETCIYNKLACLYLGINLLEKSYFDFELEPTTIYIICLANILVAGYLTYKGISIIVKC